MQTTCTKNLLSGCNRLSIRASALAVIRGSAVRVVVVALILFGQTSAAQASPGARHVGSIADLLQQAEAGNAQAQYELGIHYYDGAGVPKDSANALKCFREAADQDHALAQLALGRFYREGRLGLEKNPQEAVAGSVRQLNKATHVGNLRSR
jgi:Sel1 repeat-containing protein